MIKLTDMLNEGKLLATAPTEERIIKLISDFYFGSTISLHPTDIKTIFDVHNLKGKINGVSVINKGGRFRFERS